MSMTFNVFGSKINYVLYMRKNNYPLLPLLKTGDFRYFIV